jgi:4-amino-4-deoxy-L-arabinose transferase-like glycosyltransferase
VVIRSVALPRTAGRALTIGRVLSAALLIAAGLYILAFIVAAALRLTFPYPLEITEGATLEAVRGLLHGQPLYAEPSLDHVPLIYGPVYFYLSALVALLSGPTFLAPRLVSLLASVGSLACIYGLVRRETARPGAGLVAAGVFAASYPLSQGALDLGRVDALLTCLLLAALGAARGSGVRWVCASGCLAGLAVLTKQTAVPVVLALLVYVAVARGRRELLGFAASCVATLGVPLALLELQSGHWATLFLIQLPMRHELSELRLGQFWTGEILPRFTLALAIGPLFLLARARARDYRSLAFYLLASASMLGIAWAAGSNQGAAPNVRLPAYAILAVLFGLGLDEALRQLGHLPREQRIFLEYGVCVGLLQLVLLVYNPRELAPYRSEAWADDRLVATLAALPGQLFAPDFDTYVRVAGRPEQPYSGSAAELLGGYGGQQTPEGTAWVGLIAAPLRQHVYDYIVLDPESPNFFFEQAAESAGYADAGPLFPADDPFWLWRTGRVPKAEVYVPRERLAAEVRPR